jgi:tryptophan synthase beta chain
MTDHYENVAIIGAGGQVGGFIARALIEQGKHKVTAITCPDSKSEMPSGLHNIAKADYDDRDALAAALKGQEILVITLGIGAAKDSQMKLVDAAAAAGVKVVMPNEWGGDYANETYGNDVGIGPGIKAVREYIEKAGLARITLACGFWYEFSLSGAELRYGFDFKERKFVVYSDGTQKIATSTWPQVGRAVAKLLAFPVTGSSPCLKDYYNSTCYVQSFFVNQVDMFESVKRVTGTQDSDWKITHQKVEDRYKEGQEEFKTGNWRGFGKFLYARAFFPDAPLDFSGKLDNEKLGLPEEDIDEYTKIAVEYVDSGKAATWS